MSALREFVADLLDSEGALVEPVEPDSLDVLAPEPLRAAMSWPELARLGFGAQLPPGAMAVGLEGDWLDQFGALLGSRGRLAERQLVLAVPSAPPGDPERRLEPGQLRQRTAAQIVVVRVHPGAVTIEPTAHGAQERLQIAPH